MLLAVGYNLNTFSSANYALTLINGTHGKTGL